MDFGLLRRLTAAPGLPGQEGAVREIVLEYLRETGLEIFLDPLGSVIARAKGTGQRLLIDAHMDEVGLMVQHVDESGFLRVIPVGGLDPKVLYGQAVVVWGAEPVPGVVGAVPPHLLGREDAQRDKVVPVEDLFVDCGLAAGEAAALIRVGDPVTFPSVWHENSRSVQARALDDRVGLFVMLEALKEAPLFGCDLVLVASAQEEVGLRGASPVARRIDPDLVLVLEGTVANDLPGVAPHRTLARLGAGPEIRLGDGRFLADRAWSRFIVECAEQAGLAHQIVVKNVGGTNAAAFQIEGTGARAAALSVPVRYIHAPVGVLWKSDVEAAVALVVRLCQEVGRFCT